MRGQAEGALMVVAVLVVCGVILGVAVLSVLREPLAPRPSEFRELCTRMSGVTTFDAKGQIDCTLTSPQRP